MKKDRFSLRTQLGKVRGLGSAREGTEHWWQIRVSSIAIAILSIYLVTIFFMHIVSGGYEATVIWLSSPFASTAIILFLIAGFYHAALGLQVVIEDYIHSEGLKLFSILAIKFIAAACAVLGILATAVILLESIIHHA